MAFTFCNLVKFHPLCFRLSNINVAKQWRRFRLTLGLIFDTSGWQASQIERARTTYPDSEWHRGEIERQGMYRFQNFFDMGISIFVAIFVHIGYVYICEQILFRLSERLREGG